jgi:HD-GYP domain-containing protein (c-di-GMP phosphodiesterase class II)
MVTTGQICLEGRSSTLQGLSWTFDRQLSVGRDPNMDIVLADPSVGRHHADIHLTPRGWTVRDLGTPAGTFINGIRVEEIGRKLEKDDLLQCGRLALAVKEAQIERPCSPSALSAPADIKATGALVRIQAFSRLSWEEGLREQPLDRVAAPARHFLTLIRAGYHLSRIDAIPELLQSLLDDIVVVLDAQRGAILLAEDDASSLTLKTISGPKSRDSGPTFSKTLANRCFRNGDSLLCANVGREPAANDGHGDMMSIICGLLRSPRRRLGVLHLDRGSNQDPFTEDDLRLVDAIAATASVGLESAMAVKKLRTGFMSEAAAMLLQAIRLRDPEAAAHCQRVRRFAVRLASELALSTEENQILPVAALLHDLGNIAAVEPLLKKNGKRTRPTPDALQNHVSRGVAIAQECSELAPLLPVLRHQYEHWDGSGCPEGLKGEAIPKLARLIATANLLDELMDACLPTPEMSSQQILEAFAKEAGRRLDPSMVSAALRISDDLLAINLACTP